jgi:drug/metabolite transporter (DMT)-like permease
MSTRLSSLLYPLLIGFLLGSTLVVTRYSLGQFNSQAFVALRLMVGAAAFLFVYIFLRPRSFPRERNLWLRAGVFGIISTALTMTAYTQSLRYQSSGVTALLASLSPVETVLLAHLFLNGETITPRRIAGALLAFAGAGLLLLRGESGLAELARADWRGYAWALLGGLTNSFGLVYARRFLQQDAPFAVTSIRILTAAVLIGAFTGLTAGFDLSRVQWTGVAALLYAGIAGTFLAFLAYLVAVQRFGATSASLSEYFVPLVASVLGVVLLGEQFTPGLALGMVLIFLGLGLFHRAGTRVLK